MTKPFSYYILVLLKIFLINVIILLIGLQVVKVFDDPSYGAWGIYHYYIGSKYFRELGYFDLYSCTIESKNKAWQSAKVVRGLTTYSIVPLAKLPKCPRERFTGARWNEFRQDIALLHSRGVIKELKRVNMLRLTNLPCLTPELNNKQNLEKNSIYTR